MSETMESRLKEAMERRADDVPVPTSAPARVLRRTRRRQVGVAVVAGVAAILLGIGSFVALREVWHTGTTPGGTAVTTRTVDGVTVTYPSGWDFENAMAGTRGSALFIVANYTPSVPFVSLEDRTVCTPTAAVMALQDHSLLGGGSNYPLWPVTLRPGGTRVPGCARSLVAKWRGAGRSFGAAVLFGRDVSSRDEAALLGVFRSLRFGPATARPTGGGDLIINGTPVARGTTAGQAWVVSVEGSGGGLSVSAETGGQGVGIGVAQSPTGRLAPLSVSALPLGRGPGVPHVAFGLVSASVSSVHIEPTHEIGKLYPIRGHRQMQAFVVIVDSLRPGATVVAEDEGGKILAQEPLGAQAAPTPSPTPVQVNESVLDSGVTGGVRWSLVETFSSAGIGIELRYGNARAGFAPGTLRDSPLTIDTAVVGHGPNAEDFIFGSAAPWVSSVTFERIGGAARLYLLGTNPKEGKAFLARGRELVRRGGVLVARSANGKLVHSEKIRPDPKAFVAKG